MHFYEKTDQISYYLSLGLDPTGPLFFIKVPFDRIDATDAKLVEVIHTCAGKLGFEAALGHVDYWPNGGLHQPGCLDDPVGSCSHERSYYLYAESLKTGNFKAWQCDSYELFSNGSCKNGVSSFMGGITLDEK